MQIQKYAERIFLALLGILPISLARHALFLLNSNPHLTDRWGYHVRPIHYYEPLPDFQILQDIQFEKERQFVAIDFRLREQIKLFEHLGVLYLDELTELVHHNGADKFDFHNAYFSSLDACLYYALIRELKPARIIEVGSGYSTRIAASALKINSQENVPGNLICIEPYPEPRLTEAQLDITLIKTPVEELGMEQFENLDNNDILFIDSSHVARFDGDVCKEILDILPRLKPGVWIHVHDIFFPHDYPSDWLKKKRLAFNEQYMLEAFLAFNQEFTICAANYWMCLKYENIVRKLCPKSVIPEHQVGCSSFWMRKTD